MAGTMTGQGRFRLVALGVAAGLAVGVAGTGAATGWRVFATATDTGQYGAYASASGKVVRAKALAVRASGGVDSVSWYLSCQADIEPARPGVYTVSVASADTCSLSGSAVGDGTVTLQLLKR